jgi:hypothetical protein
MHEDPNGPSQAYPEGRYVRHADTLQPQAGLRTAALAAAGALAGGLLVWGLRQARRRGIPPTL